MTANAKARAPRHPRSCAWPPPIDSYRGERTGAVAPFREHLFDHLDGELRLGLELQVFRDARGAVPLLIRMSASDVTLRGVSRSGTTFAEVVVQRPGGAG
jgi:hypothetical protein